MALTYLDLHIHSVLSPCADRTMIPSKVFSRLMQLGIKVFSICDHNSTKNVRAFHEYGERYCPEMLFIPGVEVTTSEEVHVLGLFPTLEKAESFERFFNETLIKTEKLPHFFEPQMIVDFEGRIKGEEPKALYLATSLNFEETVSLLREHKALVVGAHIDRPSYSVLSQLGFIPEDVFDVIEVSPNVVAQVISRRGFYFNNNLYVLPENIPIITSTDAHSIEEIGQVRTGVIMESYSFDGLIESLKRETKLELLEVD